MAYILKNLETGEVAEHDLDFSFVMENQDAAGIITIKGVEHKRMVGSEFDRDGLIVGSKRMNYAVTTRESSFALAVSPAEVKEARKNWQNKYGSGVDFKPDGTMVITGRRLQQRILADQNRINGIVDKDSYY